VVAACCDNLRLGMSEHLLGAVQPSLRGRRRERAAIDRLLDGVRAGSSGALVVRGEAGIGKTALLQYTVRSASDLRIARAAGVESDMELAFAALHQLCVPVLDRLERLPAPQRAALETVFGLGPGDAPDRFLVGLAILSLLSDAAQDRALLCVIDDAQWLDLASAQVLSFVARRLVAESVAVVLATRESTAELRGLPELVLEGLGDTDARELLGSVLRGPLDAGVRERIIAETRGNPLALLELPRGFTPGELAGGFGLLDMPALSGRIEESFQRRLAGLPADTQLLLLVAAAEPVGDPALVARAAERLGIARHAMDPAVLAGLLEVGTRVRFRHPLVRSAVYRAASPADRRRAHGALAEATDPEVDPDRRAWHRADAAQGLDEDVAAELERSAGRARGRGGLAAAAAFLERAVRLTVDPSRRAQRALGAAHLKHLAGAPDAALRLLSLAQAGPLDELGRVRLDLLRAQIVHSQEGGAEGLSLLLQAAKRLEELDGRLARDTYLDALAAATYIARRAPGSGVMEVARAALAVPPAPEPARASDLLLDGLAVRFAEGYAAGAPMLKRALKSVVGEDVRSEEALRWMWLATRTAADLWDDDAFDALASRHVELARATGALSVLPLALSQRIAAHTFAGDLTAAAPLIDELRAVTEATHGEVLSYGPLVVAVWRSDEPVASSLIAATREEALSRGDGVGLTIADWASAVLHNGFGRYADALPDAERASGHTEVLGFANWALAELIIAAVRTGHTDRAAEAFERLSQLTRASGTEWALGIEARSRALLSEGDVADRLYQEAIDRLGRTRIRVELARAHLLYGEWLRRERRRVDAREQLRLAGEMLGAMEIKPFAWRAARELVATGERARKRTDDTREDLTPQEVQVARLARDGLSNPQIAARLFISPRTAEYHLGKVFSKLDISSRNQLVDVLPPGPRA
jgi:DNA-binding CsgD family transcriptional regulator